MEKGGAGDFCRQKFVVCPYVDEETNGSYPFANRLNVLADLWFK